MEQFKHAIVYGKSVKHQPQRVGLSHQLEDEDICEWYLDGRAGAAGTNGMTSDHHQAVIPRLPAGSPTDPGQRMWRRKFRSRSNAIADCRVRARKVRTGPGSGLGLALVNLEVEAMVSTASTFASFARGPVGLFIDRQQRQATPDQRPHGAAEAAVLGHDTLLQRDQPDGAIDGV